MRIVLLSCEFKLIYEDFLDVRALLFMDANDFTFKSSSTVLWKFKTIGPFYDAGSKIIFFYSSAF